MPFDDQYVELVPWLVYSRSLPSSPDPAHGTVHRCIGQGLGHLALNRLFSAWQSTHHRAVCKTGEQTGSIFFRLTRERGLGVKRPVTGLGQFRVGICISSNPNSVWSSGQNVPVFRYNGYSGGLPGHLELTRLIVAPHTFCTRHDCVTV